MSKALDFGQSQKRLAILWVAGGLSLFMLMFIKTRHGPFDGAENEAWGWLLPNIIPTISLVIAVLVQQARSATNNQDADSFLFWICIVLSSLYLALIALVMLSHPFSSISPLEYIKGSNVWLGPLQGLVTASLGAFFVKR